MDKKVNIVAELGCNHMGDMNVAMEMIIEAKECGADYVKFQKRCIESMSEEAQSKPYPGRNSFGKTYGEHRSALEFSDNDFVRLINYAESVGIGCFTTPFDIESLEQLVALGEKYVKFGSTQIHDKKMISWWADNDHDKSDLIMSTGMMGYGDVVAMTRRLNPKVVMQTTSCYPCMEKDINLNVLLTYNISEEVGLSGHHISGNGAIEASAVALGATWVERHFTLDRTWKGTDQACSLEPEGLKNVVKAVRTVERAMGDGKKRLLDCELNTWRKVNG